MKKSEFKKRYWFIQGIKVANNRIMLSDSTSSIFMLWYNNQTNQFSEIADDILPWYVTNTEILDAHSTIVSDKFGNLCVLRIPKGAEQEYSEDYAAFKFTWDLGYLNGAAIKMNEIARIYLINLITCFSKIS